VHADVRRQEVDDRLAILDPEGDVVQGLRLHGARLATHYFLASTARCSCCLFIPERPGTFLRLASL
jgi:hypothetical protein